MVKSLNVALAGIVLCLCVAPIASTPALADYYWRERRAEWREYRAARREARYERLLWQCQHGDDYACWRLRHW